MIQGQVQGPVRRLGAPTSVPTVTVPKAVASTFWKQVLPQGDADAVRVAISALVAAGDVIAILGGAIAWGILYHLAFYEETGATQNFLNVGLSVAVFFVGANALRKEYQAEQALSREGAVQRLFGTWTVAFLFALALGFVTKTTGVFSRGATLLFYAGGFAGLVALRACVVSLARSSRTSRAALVRRALLVGYEADLAAFRARSPEEDGARLRVVATSVLRPARGSDRPEAQLGEDLALAAHTARFVQPDDIVILMPWAEHETIDRCVDAFLNLPASIHLGPERVLDRFSTDVTIGRLGNIASINLVGKPLSAVEIAAKRAFDLVVAALALALLAPVLALVALLIKLDGPGPVLFTQKRYGFNQKPFRIYKFRSMTTLEDGAFVRQATRGDARITRIGRILRRWNLDELPQFLNVLRGEMSVVGPRPHAMAHDQAHERQFARYARRHNVKPGITGWAQVNGFRGEILTEDQMRARVEHDLAYIDRWSLWLDLKILFLTVISPKAYRNAG